MKSDQPSKPWQLPVGLAGLLLAFLAWPRVQENTGMVVAFVGAAGLLLIGTWVVFKSAATPLTIERVVRLPHAIQIPIHAGVYIYWGWHWSTVYDQLPLFAAQIIFAYGVDMLLSWRKFGNWRAGFGPWPVIGSLNLFMWFRDDIYAAQFVLVAVAYWARFYITWMRDGRRTHIFNPSGIALALAAFILIALGQTELTWAADIAVHLDDGLLIYWAIFALGMTVQSFVPVVLITLSAALTVMAVHGYYMYFYDLPFFVDRGIPAAVFLGMNLLITDPASSPRDTVAKILYGIAYGVAVLALYPVLIGLETQMDPPVPLAHFDKLLFVPLLNLAVPLFDRVGRLIPRPMRPKNWAEWVPNRIHQAIWFGAFLLLVDHITFTQGQRVLFWQQRCEQGVAIGCKNMENSYIYQCNAGDGEVCYTLGDLYESGEKLPQDLGKAVKAYEQACEAGSGEGCSHLGVLLMNGTGIDKNPKLARALFKKSCAAKDLEGCDKLALAMLMGAGGPRQPAKAAIILQAGCDGGFAESCVKLGKMSFRGDGVPLNRTKGQKLMARACRLGFEAACPP